MSSFATKLFRKVSLVLICSLLFLLFWDGSQALRELSTRWPSSRIVPFVKASVRLPTGAQHPRWKGAQHPRWKDGLLRVAESAVSLPGERVVLAYQSSQASCPLVQRGLIVHPLLFFVWGACFCSSGVLLLFSLLEIECSAPSSLSHSATAHSPPSRDRSHQCPGWPVLVRPNPWGHTGGCYQAWLLQFRFSKCFYVYVSIYHVCMEACRGQVLVSCPTWVLGTVTKL